MSTDAARVLETLLLRGFDRTLAARDATRAEVCSFLAITLPPFRIGFLRNPPEGVEFSETGATVNTILLVDCICSGQAKQLPGESS